ncbi:FAD dependent oxidoreductase [Filobasidium floriforme]|uniref:FAD dependent oxidoreductase n=1 Tax=Filobasidium floriforme TaxID=5210 RepID=UPI001E8D5171|nr:FAD dependent oxidoreductase [Filobasidium floriforme]KAH8089005.1 FAD dependent oxidoreductase [Filobasidium floriforme]
MLFTKLTLDTPILIVGGTGTIGSSTALHLRRRGYTNLKLIDSYPFPSGGSGNSQSAGGSDLNKIVGYADGGVRGELAEETMRGWREDPVFREHYYEVGELALASLLSNIASLRSEYIHHKTSPSNHPDPDPLEWLSTPSDIIHRAPHLKAESIQGWQGTYRPRAGWAGAMDAIDSVGEELKRLGGVEMVFGSSGSFSRPLIDPLTSRCIGVIAKDGTRHFAERVVMATGAWTPSLVDLEGQCVSKCWIVAHLELTDAEAARYRGIPVVYNEEVGFLFEPRYVLDPSTGTSRWIIKLCDEFPGYTRYLPARPFRPGSDKKHESIEVSVPRSHSDHPTDTVPDEGMERLRRVVEVMLPEFREREFVKSYCCWCTDTDDAEWLFCEHPSCPGLFLATGDSGHSFTSLPVVGGQVADLLEGKMSPERMERLGWRPGRGDPDHTGRGGPPAKDLGDLPGWAHGDDPKEV